MGTLVCVVRALVSVYYVSDLCALCVVRPLVCVYYVSDLCALCFELCAL